MAQTSKVLTDIAIKRLSGKAHTSAQLSLAQEGKGSTVQTLGSTVFGEQVPNEPNKASSELYKIQSGSVGENGTVQLVDFEVIPFGSPYENTTDSDAVDSADQATAVFLINAKVEKALSKLKDSDNRYLLDPYASYLGEASLCGRRVVTSNNVPSNLTKGSGSNLSAIIYGDFSQLMIAMFSNVEVLVDPYSDFASGKVGIRALASFDIGIRQPSAFASIVDAVAS